MLYLRYYLVSFSSLLNIPIIIFLSSNQRGVTIIVNVLVNKSYKAIQYNTIQSTYLFVINQIFNAVVAYQAVEEIFNRIDREQNGKLDVLVNNAYAGKLSNPEYIHLKVNETINYKKTVQFYSAIFLLQFFELRYFFPLIRNHSWRNTFNKLENNW